MAFTSEQQAEYDRLSAERKIEYDPNKEKLERFTVPQLKAKVNIISVGSAVNWADESNYTSAEKEYIEAAMPRIKWAINVPLILAEAVALEADGASTTVIKSILKSR